MNTLEGREDGINLLDLSADVPAQIGAVGETMLAGRYQRELSANSADRRNGMLDAQQSTLREAIEFLGQTQLMAPSRDRFAQLPDQLHVDRFGDARIEIGNAVAPGVINTDMSSFAKTDAGRDYTLGLQALQRIGEPEDVGPVVAFLASDAARWITGDTLRVDGGSKL
jgi:hypothetical protein